MTKKWVKELARDLIALGSLPFYALVLVRMLIPGAFGILVPRLIVAFIVLLLISLVIQYHGHIARGLILVVFTSLAYEDLYFTLLAGIIYLGMLASANTLKVKKMLIWKGVAVGAISTAAGYSVSLLFL